VAKLEDSKMLLTINETETVRGELGAPGDVIVIVPE
jgi:hypothetical protein